MTVQELKESMPEVYFVKTNTTIDRPNAGLIRDIFIPDSDMPEFPIQTASDITPRTRLYPLSVTAYPAVLKRMTAMAAGAWAISKCREQSWELSFGNLKCCLANLEMDF